MTSKMIQKNKPFKCSICKSNRATNILKLNCGNFDNSTLYQSVKVVSCSKCGHIYNKLTSAEIISLVKYYNEEYAPTNINSKDQVNDRPGSNNPSTSERYSYLYDLISPYIKRGTKILDAGCAMGGFLDYLSEKGMNKLYGVDISKKYIDYVKKRSIYKVKLGNIESIPFNNGSFDLVVMDQVLEHLAEPRKIFKEARRVLADNGLLCISVPDASRYNKKYFFDFYWFILREHLQHFDIEHLKLLAVSEGFELIDQSKYNTPMTSEKAILPALSVVFRLTVNWRKKPTITRNCFKLKKVIKQYITQNSKKLNKKTKIINLLITSQKPIYIWGIGREFLFLYNSTSLKKCNIVNLIDTNPYKQKIFSADGRRIVNKLVLKKAESDSAVIITAFGHVRQIKKDITKIGYRGKVIKI